MQFNILLQTSTSHPLLTTCISLCTNKLIPVKIKSKSPFMCHTIVKFILLKLNTHLLAICERLKAQPNARNISTQHLVLNIVVRNVLHAFDHSVATCCKMLDGVGSSLKMVTFLDVARCCMCLASSFTTSQNTIQQCCKMLC